jgi:hypothetical protein
VVCFHAEAGPGRSVPQATAWGLGQKHFFHATTRQQFWPLIGVGIFVLATSKPLLHNTWLRWWRRRCFGGITMHSPEL